MGAGDSSDVGRWRCGSAASSGKGRQSVHWHMPRHNELPLPLPYRRNVVRRPFEGKRLVSKYKERKQVI